MQLSNVLHNKCMLTNLQNCPNAGTPLITLGIIDTMCWHLSRYQCSNLRALMTHLTGYKTKGWNDSCVLCNLQWVVVDFKSLGLRFAFLAVHDFLTMRKWLCHKWSGDFNPFISSVLLKTTNAFSNLLLLSNVSLLQDVYCDFINSWETYSWLTAS